MPIDWQSIIGKLANFDIVYMRLVLLQVFLCKFFVKCVIFILSKFCRDVLPYFL